MKQLTDITRTIQIMGDPDQIALGLCTTDNEHGPQYPVTLTAEGLHGIMDNPDDVASNHEIMGDRDQVAVDQGIMGDRDHVASDHWIMGDPDYVASNLAIMGEKVATIREQYPRPRAST